MKWERSENTTVNINQTQGPCILQLQLPVFDHPSMTTKPPPALKVFYTYCTGGSYRALFLAEARYVYACTLQPILYTVVPCRILYTCVEKEYYVSIIDSFLNAIHIQRGQEYFILGEFCTACMWYIVFSQHIL